MPRGPRWPHVFPVDASGRESYRLMGFVNVGRHWRCGHCRSPLPRGVSLGQANRGRLGAAPPPTGGAKLCARLTCEENSATARHGARPARVISWLSKRRSAPATLRLSKRRRAPVLAPGMAPGMKQSRPTHLQSLRGRRPLQQRPQGGARARISVGGEPWRLANHRARQVLHRSTRACCTSRSCTHPSQHAQRTRALYLVSFRH